MIIGHLPAGYLLSSALFQRLAAAGGVARGPFVTAGILGALAPDLDMLYFHLVDQRRHHHHNYFTHFPSFWAALVLASAVWRMLAAKNPPGPVLALAFSINGLLHMALDSVVGDIWWLAPLDGGPFSLATVPAPHQPWWLNFLLHWSFLLELSLALGALVLWRRRNRRGKARAEVGPDGPGPSAFRD